MLCFGALSLSLSVCCALRARCAFTVAEKRRATCVLDRSAACGRGSAVFRRLQKCVCVCVYVCMCVCFRVRNAQLCADTRIILSKTHSSSLFCSPTFTSRRTRIWRSFARSHLSSFASFTLSATRSRPLCAWSAWFRQYSRRCWCKACSSFQSFRLHQLLV